MDSDEREQIAGIIGLGNDPADGHVRLTRGDRFSVLLGSEYTHELMQTTCIRIDDLLKRRGKRLEDLTRDEFIELITDMDMKDHSGA